MRNSRAWRSKLAQDIWAQALHERGDAQRLCDVELGLSMLSMLLEGSDPDTLGLESVPLLLTGHEPQPVRVEILSDHEKRRALSVGRHLLRHFENARTWRAELRWYERLNEAWRLFDVNLSSNHFESKPVSVVPERRKVYRRTLSSSPPHIESRVDYATPGVWRFAVGDEWGEVEIPDEAPVPGESDVRVSLSSEEKPVISARWSDLKKTAKWMTERSDGRDWLKDMENVVLDSPSACGDPKDPTLNIDGTFHLAGMVSSGKSTLMDVLAVHLSRDEREGKRVTLVVGDVVDQVNRVRMFNSLGIPSAPLLGVGGRKRHSERIERVASADLGDTWDGPIVDERLRWVSRICPLLGNLRGEAVPAYGKEPCRSLRKPDESDGKRYACPYMPVCPTHRARNELMEARVWVASPESLLYTRAPEQGVAERVRLLELVYRHSDLLIVDEVDMAQMRLDDAFAPKTRLLSPNGDGLLDEVIQKSRPAPNSARSRYVADSATRRWTHSQRQAQEYVEMLLSMARETNLVDWIEPREVFHSFSLTRKIHGEVVSDPNSATIPDSVIDGLTRPREDMRSPIYELNMTAFNESGLLTERTEDAEREAVKWLLSQYDLEDLRGDVDEAKLGARMRLTVAVATLDEMLNRMDYDWEAGAASYDIAADSVASLRRPPREYGHLVPSAALGNLFGFQRAGDDGGWNELALFRYMGIGRWLVHHLNDLFEGVDGLRGPATLIMSGSSWAPGSSRYHVDVPISGALRSPKEILDGIEESVCMFTPAKDGDGKPIRVSGKRDDDRGDWRTLALKQALEYLHATDSFDEELEIGDGRKLLVVVGSYRETRAAVDYLRQARGEDEVTGLRRDDDPDDEGYMARGLVARFGESAASILVAPLGAIERGHNILISDGKAAIGSVFFMVRPMPRPYDMSDMVKRLNAWAMREWKRDDGRDIEESLKSFRRRAYREWDKLSSLTGTYESLSDTEREDLAWTQMVSLWQTAGRGVRGGSAVRIHFVDAAFAPKSAEGGVDSAKTSLLVAIRDALEKAFAAGGDDARMARTLYGPWMQAISNVEGLRTREEN